MKRFSSLDFLRGTAILMMLVLHMISHVLDVDRLLADLNNQALINIVLLVILPFMGGLAGFFLLTSAISNMVSMYKVLERGESPNQLIKKQVVGGFILLIFAMLSEGLIGYWGAFGLIIRDIGVTWNPERYLTVMLSRWNHMETIHTIAWCIILNGLIQGLLSRNNGHKNVPKMLRSYLIIAISIIILTIPVWLGINTLIPGYPYEINPETDLQMYLPLIGKSPFWFVIVAPFLAMLAGHPEPVFPYLAVSCIGSIIGIIICQPKEQIPKGFMKKSMLISLACFVIGAIGMVITVIGVMDSMGFESAAGLWQSIWDHRGWFPDRPTYGSQLTIVSWLWQFLFLNGFGTMFTLIVIYLVEFRGIGPQFANYRTVRFIRRFGFTAFTNYNNQWYYYLVWNLVSLIIMGAPMRHMLWDGVIIVIILSILLYHGIMLLWEKVGYVGTIEWMIGTIAASLIPQKRKEGFERQKWWERGKLDVKNAFYEAEWMSVVVPDEQYHKDLRDSKVIEKISKIALGSVLFFAFNVFTLVIALDIRKIEGNNPHVKKAITISLIGTLITIVFLAFCFIATPNSLGIPL